MAHRSAAELLSPMKWHGMPCHFSCAHSKLLYGNLSDISASCSYHG